MCWRRRVVLGAWHTEDNANVELVPWRSEKVVTSLVERYRPPRCRKVQEKKRNSCESRYLAFGQGWLKGAQDWLKWWDKDGKFVRKDFRRWLAAGKGGRRLKMKSRRDIAAAKRAGWAGLRAVLPVRGEQRMWLWSLRVSGQACRLDKKFQRVSWLPAACKKSRVWRVSSSCLTRLFARLDRPGNSSLAQN